MRFQSCPAYFLTRISFSLILIGSCLFTLPVSAQPTQVETQERETKSEQQEAADQTQGKQEQTQTERFEAILRQRFQKQAAENEDAAELIADVLNLIENNYVEEVDRQKLLEAALNGIMAELDQHSAYIPPAEISQFRGSIDKSYGGIGVQVSLENGEMKVISPFFGSPAYKEGIMAGDVILSIQGQSTEGMTLDRAAELTTGEIGTEVLVTVRRTSSDVVEELKLVRATIKMETVLGDSRRPDESWEFYIDAESKIACVRLTGFGRTTADELRQTLSHLIDDGMQGLILDLRFNPGGLLSSAIQISDMFIDEGRIVSTQSRTSPPRVWEATSKSTLPNFPMVVLVNQYSASASEIVAACLKDHGRAIVIGQRTFGKGSVQNVVPLTGGSSALKLTTATYYRPNGRNIHRREEATDEDEWGVEPNDGFEVLLTEDEVVRFLKDRRLRDVVGETAEPVSVAENTTEPAQATIVMPPRPPKLESLPFVDEALKTAVAHLRSQLVEQATTDLTQTRN